MLLNRLVHLGISCLILLTGLEHLFTFPLDSLALFPPNSLMLAFAHQARASKEKGGLIYNVTYMCLSRSGGEEKWKFKK